MADISKLDMLTPKISGVGGVASKPTNLLSDTNVEESFSDLLKSALESVNNAQVDADVARKQLITGESTDIASTMVALQKASVSLDIMLEVRNKLLEAYQEVMRTQV